MQSLRQSLSDEGRGGTVKMAHVLTGVFLSVCVFALVRRHLEAPTEEDPLFQKF